MSRKKFKNKKKQTQKTLPKNRTIGYVSDKPIYGSYPDGTNNIQKFVNNKFELPTDINTEIWGTETPRSLIHVLPQRKK